MSAETEECIAGTKFRSVWCYAGSGVALRHVQCDLGPVESDTDGSSVNEAVAHVVEFCVRQPEDREYSKRLSDLLNDRRGDRCSDHRCRIRSEDKRNGWILRDPIIDELEERVVERQCQGGCDEPAPEERSSKQPSTLALAPVEEPKDGKRHDG